ncbi:L-seryl-tRNA(Sec) kinase [Phytophthora ramorum]|uniref:L-seryl-tRNA(Sec) kinase n=1 Tax=Phytophthora ramorum TaxID=164328 RepID=UPI0030B266CF|nr:L-seryl-tRNA(Sec) kinase [Phytophthora ramorum]
MSGSSWDAVLVLVCGLPAAGKTTLVKHLVARGSVSTRLYERISLDDLYEQVMVGGEDCKPTDFDPDKWKACQQEMVARVGKRLKQHEAPPITNDAAQQLVVLVDDNFQYRSLRKRFFHLATKLNCGFALLYVNVPTEICLERNAARSGGARVPAGVFERMANAFEAPNGHQNLWEANAFELNDTDDDSKIGQVMDALLVRAGDELKERRLLRIEKQKEEAQQRRDRLTTQQSVLHLVDLELRRWISAQLQDESALSSGMTKAKLASQLNQHRKDYLASIKKSSASDFPGLVRGKAIEEVVVSFVQRFQQYQE